jgi:hypothetical protein
MKYIEWECNYYSIFPRVIQNPWFQVAHINNSKIMISIPFQKIT